MIDSFVTRARSSRDSILREGEELLAAGRRFGEVVQEEARGWRDFLRTQAVLARQDVRSLPTRVEERLLGEVDGALERIEGRVQERLRLLRDGAPAPEEPPLPDYDRLTARDIVAKLEALDPDRRRAVYEFERAHKARATVLKAAERAA